MDNDLNIVFLEDRHGAPAGMYFAQSRHEAMQYAEGWSQISPAFIFPRHVGRCEDSQAIDDMEGLS